MYNVNSNIAYINGKNGIYDNKVTNQSACYGRNAVNNFKTYIADFVLQPVEMPDLSGLVGLSEDKFEAKMAELNKSIEELKKQKTPPVKFEYTYSELKDGSIDTVSLMGASFEELGDVSVKTKKLSKQLKDTFTPGIFRQILANIKAFFNGRSLNKIEFYKSKASAKALDLNNDGNVDISEYAASILVADKLSDGKIDGKENNQGSNNLLAYTIGANYNEAKAEFSALYDQYNLAQAKQDFLSESNNLEF